MSYDVSLVPDPSGRLGWNMTTNCAPMWRLAGCDLAEFHGRPARVLGIAAALAVAAMIQDPDRFRILEPANGWGSYESCRDFLIAIAEGCAERPDATVEVWR